MIRASLSDRRCVSSSCCRWLRSDRGGRTIAGVHPSRGSRLPSITSSSSSIQSHSYHSLSRGSRNRTQPSPSHYRRTSTSWKNVTETFSHHHRRTIPTALMSTKPSYDFQEYDDHHDDDDSSDLQWLKRSSSSSLDNFSSYDNYSQYEKVPPSSSSRLESHSSLTPLERYHLRKSSTSEGGQGSLLDLLNSDEQPRSKSSPGEGGSLLDLLNNDDASDAHHMSQHQQANDTVDAERVSSLLDLLHKDIDYHDDVDNDGRHQSSSFSQPSYNGHYEMDHSQPIHQSNQEGSLLDLLNDGSQIQEHHEPAASLYDLLDETTKNIDDKDSKYKDLAKLQLQLETESTEESMLKVLDVWNAARDRSDHATIPMVRRAMDSWYGPLTEAIELEQWLYLNGDNDTLTKDLMDHIDPDSPEWKEDGYTRTKRSSKDRTIYGPLLCLLPPRKIAVLLAHTALSFGIASKEEFGTKVVRMALHIAEALETEVNVSRTLRVRANERKVERVKMNVNAFGDEEGSNIEDPDSDHSIGDDLVPGGTTTGGKSNIDSWVYTATHLQRFLDEVSGKGLGDLKGQGKVSPAKVKRKCKEILLAEGFASEQDQTINAEAKKVPMNEFEEWDPVKRVKLGSALLRLLLDHTTFSKPLEKGYAPPEPAFKYRRVKTSETVRHGYIAINRDLMDIAVNEDFTSTTAYLSPSLSNSRVQPMVIPPKEWTDVNNGGYETIKVPFMRTRQCKTQKDSLNRADLSKVMEGLNVLGNIPWRINQTVLDVAQKCWEDGIVLGDIPSRVDYEVPPVPEELGYVNYHRLGDMEKKAHIEDFKKYRDALNKHKRFKQKNADLHSLRCSAMLKLNQAQKFRDFEEIFFPYNVDFRGRAYPVPPHLSIVGSDLCRALLVFAEPKPLGENGLYWLKVHLANLAGADKMSFDGRANFADENMDNIRDAVNDPLGENNWWTKFDDPFQGLATCHEIVKAIDSGDPANYMCRLPVHMDGSCNGLQHYAALGRDKAGGKAVNLCVADEPQDVYIGVMHEVIRRVAEDADEIMSFDENSPDLTRGQQDKLKKVKSARLVNGLIDRGVVKRTVMTSVYGVTYIGAKNQIGEKIEEKLEERGHDIDEIESEINTACGYLASLTMEVMGQQFKGARSTMNWLTECARLIAAQGQPVSFISPIGVPVVQPYRQRRNFSVVTLLQTIVLTNNSDVLPLHRQRQVSAFPPNYVHSLDSSHMLLTAIEMRKRGLHFSAVHDSYWTHPCDIEEMNGVLRESFIDLYNQPLLQDLKKMWEMRYPSIEFPDCPEEGDLDLNDVRLAPYFFQ